MGAEAFAERAARELLATGEKARKRTADTRDQLTAQETQIAELARDGRSNPEIGAQLFIGTRTVEYHLQGVHEAGNQLAQRARTGAPERSSRSTGGLADSRADRRAWGPRSGGLGRCSMRVPFHMAHARGTTQLVDGER